MRGQFTWNAERVRRWVCSILLLTVATSSLLSTTMFSTAGVRWHSPTRTYQGYLSAVYYGTYRYVLTTAQCAQALLCPYPDEGVFYLETDNGFMIRLIFTCGLNDCTQSNQLPISQGARVYVEGTLIEPSQWQPAQSQPYLYFVADLYVLRFYTVT